MLQSKFVKKHGFTLIEIMVVISTIAFLASIIVASTSFARAKARDAQKIAVTREVQTAVTAMYDDKGYVPHNYDCTSTCQITNSRTTLEIEDLPGATPTESGKAYLASMNELVTNNLIAELPRTTSPNSAPYIYYDYGRGPVGAIFGTILEVVSTKNNPNGYPAGSCRTSQLRYGIVCPVGFLVDPINHSCVVDESGQVSVNTKNFCYNSNTTDYCSCIPY